MQMRAIESPPLSVLFYQHPGKARDHLSGVSRPIVLERFCETATYDGDMM